MKKNYLDQPFVLLSLYDKTDDLMRTRTDNLEGLDFTFFNSQFLDASLAFAQHARACVRLIKLHTERISRHSRGTGRACSRQRLLHY